MKKKKKDRTRWDLADALTLVRDLAPRLEAVGYHVGLTGGVLVRGTSDKDADIIVYPRSTARRAEPWARRALVAAGLVCVLDVEEIQAAWRAGGSDDGKRVDVWRAESPLPPGRVDVMWLT